jgi:hypothetical protein
LFEDVVNDLWVVQAMDENVQKRPSPRPMLWHAVAEIIGAPSAVAIALITMGINGKM